MNTLLTDEQIYEAIRPLVKTDELATLLLKISMDEYRAIEQAVLSQRAQASRTVSTALQQAAELTKRKHADFNKAIARPAPTEPEEG